MLRLLQRYVNEPFRCLKGGTAYFIGTKRFSDGLLTKNL